MDKKLMKYGGIIIGAFFIIIILSLIINSATGGAKLTYESIEEKLVNAAKRYVNNKKSSGIDVLPESYFSDAYYISSDLLVNEGYINNLSEYAKDETVCVGGVNVYNAGGGLYDYVPELTCGAYYETKRLANKVLNDNDNGITTGSGLYMKVNGKIITNDAELNMVNSENYEYIFRGDIVNNYVKIDNDVWRIVSIDNDNNLLLIYNDVSQRTYPWDDKYNEAEGRYQGVNVFANNGLNSAIYRTLSEFREGKIRSLYGDNISDKTNYLTVPMKLCIGKRSAEDTDQSGKTECATVLEDQFVGLLPAYAYMNASLDPGCTTIVSNSCGNYNYLAENNAYWWLLTANSGNTNEVYVVSDRKISSNVCSYNSYLKPTIKIGGRVIYNSGNGTLNDPYTIKLYNE